MDRKFTAWKKNRKFGDIYGGRTRLKFSDNIFARAHSLKPPESGQELPILIEDNPSRDFFFPLTGEETIKALKALPEDDYEGITHVWLRRFKKSDYIENQVPLACFICGSGVRVVVLYPWANDMLLSYGAKKPSNKILNEAEKFNAKIIKKGKTWFSKWTIEGLRKFYIQHLLYHEVGHHIDWYNRQWSKANSKTVEEYADQYAMAKTATATHIFNRLSNERELKK